MKKKILLYASVLSLVVAVNAMAAPTTSTTGSVDGWVSADSGGVIKLGTVAAGPPARDVLSLKPSANVALFYKVNATGTAYVSGSFHTSGSFAYGTSSTDTNIFRTGYVTGTDPTMPTAAADGTVAWTDWTAAK